MCGIIGYVGLKSVTPILMAGLKRMEYRGYDSSGVAIPQDGKIVVIKESGKIDNLSKQVDKVDVFGTIGLGHTRWATHGEPSQLNAHPHSDTPGKFVIVHNGIIENYYSLKTELQKKGHNFTTQTDSEVLAHLISELYEGDFEQAVRLALTQVRGTYGLAVLCQDEPDKLIAARMGSPLVVGVGDNENFIASDLAAIVEHTRNAIFLDDGDIVVITKDNIDHSRLDQKEVTTKIERISFNIEQIEKGGYPYFMLKEIHQQPNSIRDSMRGRLNDVEGNARLGGLIDFEKDLDNVKRFVILGCGTSW
ncbi:MAG: isomerizing glutamine--fructose-6-phosphate transaminase, partial [Calditrichaeota bacterium]|nr:isomerizing glutamine--fructose-6-phosphate transaminase [Calditrichota bacterium]